MQPNRLGRLLGVSARVAAEKIRERAVQASTPPPRTSAPRAASAGVGGPTVSRPVGASTPHSSPNSNPNSTVASYAAAGSRRVARGAGRFGASLWRPFAHATGVLGLQITGLFFALFSLFFAEHAWQTYKAAGWHDPHVLVYLFFMLLFGWFTTTSFWRARRKQKRS